MTDRIKWGPNIGPGWKAVAEVAQAMDQGRPVQGRVGPDHQWVPQESSPRLNAKFEYRIGEEVKPIELWVNVYPEESSTSVGYASRELADASAAFNRTGCIQVREVIE